MLYVYFEAVTGRGLNACTEFGSYDKADTAYEIAGNNACCDPSERWRMVERLTETAPDREIYGDDFKPVTR